MAYATLADVEARITRTLSEQEETVCTNLLDDAAVLIDAFRAAASDDAKKVVSCRMVIRAIGDGSSFDSVPMGATQGSMSGLGYSQSWTIGSGGSVGELYLSKTDKQLLGGGNLVGSWSPVQELAPTKDVDGSVIDFVIGGVE